MLNANKNSMLIMIRSNRNERTAHMLFCTLQELRAWADKMQSYIEQLLIEEQTKTEAQVRDALYSLASRR
jgi:hypothetical protein